MIYVVKVYELSIKNGTLKKTRQLPLKCSSLAHTYIVKMPIYTYSCLTTFTTLCITVSRQICDQMASLCLINLICVIELASVHL